VFVGNDRRTMSETNTTTLPVMTPDVVALIAAKDETIRLLTERVEKFSQQIEWLQRQLFGRKSEKIDPSQPFFDALTIQAIETNTPAAEAPKVETTVAAHTRKHTPHGRGELPAHLRREIEVVDVPAEQKVFPDGVERPVIGHEDSERLAYTPAEFFVKVTRRPKYGSPVGAEENGVVIAPVPERLVPRCLADERMRAGAGAAETDDPGSVVCHGTGA
jgi:transposase